MAHRPAMAKSLQAEKLKLNSHLSWAWVAFTSDASLFAPSTHALDNLFEAFTFFSQAIFDVRWHLGKDFFGNNFVVFHLLET